jgi:hypothetical protein
LISDIPAGDGKTANLFLQLYPLSSIPVFLKKGLTALTSFSPSLVAFWSVMSLLPSMVTVVLHFRPSVVCSSNGSPNLTTVRVETKMFVSHFAKISCDDMRKLSRKLTNVVFFFYLITKGKHFQLHVNQTDHFLRKYFDDKLFSQITERNTYVKRVFFWVDSVHLLTKYNIKHRLKILKKSDET